MPAATGNAGEAQGGLLGARVRVEGWLCSGICTAVVRHEAERLGGGACKLATTFTFSRTRCDSDLE